MSRATISVPSGQAVTFTATVRGAYAVPSGKVRFTNGNSLLATAPVTNGVAVYTTTSLSVGTRTITASYPGNLDYVPSSATIQQTVQ